MKKKLAVTTIIIITLVFNLKVFSQEKNSKSDKLFSELSENACKCIDSIPTYNKSNDFITDKVSICIDNASNAYIVGIQLMDLLENDKKNKEKSAEKVLDFSVNIDKNTTMYKGAYLEMERKLMTECSVLKTKIGVSEKQRDYSMSDDPKAIELYNKGYKEMEKEKFEKALEYYNEAIKIDPKFAFCWDNIGLCNRKLNNIPKAIEAYKKSIEIDPKGTMPLQNLAIAYQYNKDYELAIETYKKLAEIDSKNPEVFYGIGQVYAIYIKDNEKGLDNICKAYNLYLEQKSPYRSDAEKLISYIYSEMKKAGKEDKFNEILKSYNISTK